MAKTYIGVIVVVTNPTHWTVTSDQDPQNSSRLKTRCTPVVNRSFEQHAVLRVTDASREQRVVGPYSATVLVAPFLSPGLSTSVSRVRLLNPHLPR
ncbi:hypothetical protein TNCV_4927411 [Trichonephila clavipes]|nr:hypothetical protein TNCV_4927411 [Trichonephila clavipes]